MDVDSSIAMRGDDPILEIPWCSPDGVLRYYDLVSHPESLNKICEAAVFPELAEVLRRLNGPGGTLETAKCDAWSSDEMEPADEIYGASWKHGCYCDLIFRDRARRFLLAAHEDLVRLLVAFLRKAPDMPAAVELVIRRCDFWEGADSREGFAVTAFVVGYGGEVAQAQRQCGAALRLLSRAAESLDNLPETG
jgi:hypothetical protein